MSVKNEYLPFAAELREIVKHVDREWTFRFAYDGEAIPGQFVEVSVPKVGECPISVSGIGGGLIDLTIRKVGKVTDYLFENVQVGDTLFLRGPYGNGFDLNEFSEGEVLIVAGGTAVSPVCGVIHALCECAQPKDKHVIVGFKSQDEILFRKDLEKWKNYIDLTLTVDGAPEGYEGNVGLVTKYIPDVPIRDLKACKAIVVGPPPMIRFSILEMKKRGFDEENIWIDDSRKMCCGMGKCGHCRINDNNVGVDGPVFKYTEHRELLD